MQLYFICLWNHVDSKETEATSGSLVIWFTSSVFIDDRDVQCSYFYIMEERLKGKIKTRGQELQSNIINTTKSLMM